MPNFNGQLTQNEIFSAIYNMIISQQVFADNISSRNSKLANMCKVDGGQYGDTKLFYATDILASHDWNANDTSVLEPNRPADPNCQSISIKTFRQIPLTLDQYLTKRAFADEGSYAQFNSVMQGWIGDTKKVYDDTKINSFFGTHEETAGKQTQTVTLPTAGTGNTDKEAENRLAAETICKKVSDVLSELGDPSRDYNNLGYMRSYNRSDLCIVWNKEYANRIKFYANPSLYHELFTDADVELPAKYFGTVKTADGNTGSDNTTIRALVEKVYGGKDYFPGELLPNSTDYDKNEVYETNEAVICKIVHKNAVPYMSSFEVSSSFYNPKSLSTSQYLTWGHSEPEVLDDKPFITIKKN